MTTSSDTPVLVDLIAEPPTGRGFRMDEVTSSTLTDQQTCGTCVRGEFSLLHPEFGYCRFVQFSHAGSWPIVARSFGCRGYLARVPVLMVADPSEGPGTAPCARCAVEQVTNITLDGQPLCAVCADLIGREAEPSQDLWPWPEDGRCVCGPDIHKEVLRLVESGYVRTWDLERSPTGVIHAVDNCTLEAYSDEGDGTYWAECPTCLARFAPPAEWEWA